MAEQEREIVYIARDSLEASAVIGLLNTAGVENWVRDMTISPYPVSFGPLGERHILVLAPQANYARSLLERARRDGFLPSDGIVVGSVTPH